MARRARPKKPTRRQLRSATTPASIRPRLPPIQIRMVGPSSKTVTGSSEPRSKPEALGPDGLSLPSPRMPKKVRHEPNVDDVELAVQFARVHGELLGAALVAADIAMKTTSKSEAQRYAQCLMATACSLIEQAKRIATPFRIPLQVFGQTLRYPQDLDTAAQADYPYSRNDANRQAEPELSDDEFRERVDQVVGAIPTFMGDGYWDSSNLCSANAPYFDGEDFVRQSREGALSDRNKSR